MKKLIGVISLILSLTLIIALPAWAARFNLVEDRVGVLTESENLELNKLAKDIRDKYKCEISIVIVDDKGTGDVIDFAKSIYKKHEYGYGADKSGMILLLSMKERDYAIVAYGYGNTAFTDYGKSVLEDRYLLPLLKDDRYYEGFSIYLEQASEFLNMARNGTPFDIDTDEDAESSVVMILAMIIFIPLVIAGIICFILLNQMKTAVPQIAADNYISEGGVKLTMQVDKFLFRTENRTRIEKGSSSGGTSVGSDGSSSSSGKF